MKLAIPEPCLLVFIGPSGAGKSTFARKHFRPSEILSSDHCRYLVCDDENNQAATNAAFEVLHCICARRLAAGKLTVVDATNVQVSARTPLLRIARQYTVPAVAIVFQLPKSTCLDRNQTRTDRTLLQQVIETQHQEMCRGLAGLINEGFQQVYVLSEAGETDSVEFKRLSLHRVDAGTQIPEK